MTRIRSGVKTHEFRDGEGSTSDQGADVSSYYSATEDATDDTPTEQVNVLKVKLPRFPQSLHPRSAPNYDSPRPSRQPDPERQIAPSTFPEIGDLEDGGYDGGYDGDAEIQYPDDYEDVDNQSNKSRTSLLTLNGSSDNESLTEEMENLRFGSPSAQSHHRVLRKHYRWSSNESGNHKRTHSESFGSLSSGSAFKDKSSKSNVAVHVPVQKRARRMSQNADQSGDNTLHSCDEMILDKQSSPD